MVQADCLAELGKGKFFRPFWYVPWKFGQEITNDLVGKGGPS